jgi:hypothetical protein
MNTSVIFKSRRLAIRATLLLTLILTLVFASSRMQADTGNCGGETVTLPFTDVMASAFFCQIAEAYFSGLTNGTTATTYSPEVTVTREQMAAFITRTLDQSLRRGSQRAAMKRFYIGTTPGYSQTIVGDNPSFCECDGADVWVANASSGTVSRLRASDGDLLQTWTGATQAFGVVTVNDKIYVTGKTTPGSVYRINAQGTPGAVTVLSNTVGNAPEGIAYDGSNLWTANTSGSVSRVAISGGSTTTFTTGFVNVRGILFDGTNIWVTDNDNTLKKLDANGAILQTVNVGLGPRYPVYDGINIWVPNEGDDTITVVRASTGQVLATISTPPTLTGPVSAAFDGEKVLVTANSGFVAFYKATDLSLITTRNIAIAGTPGFGTCSDGTKFFVTVPLFDFLMGFN